MFAFWFLAPGPATGAGTAHRLRRHRPALAGAVRGHRGDRRARAGADQAARRRRAHPPAGRGRHRDRAAGRAAARAPGGGLRLLRLSRRALRRPCSASTNGGPRWAAARCAGCCCWRCRRSPSTRSPSGPCRCPTGTRPGSTPTDFNSIGASRDDEVRVFASLNSPGALAPLLALSLLCYLTVRPRHMALAVAGAARLCVALALTLVRSAWISLIIAALAHVIASRGSQRAAGIRRGGGGRGGHARPVPGQRDRA